jgi:hypothetical protein
VLTDSICTSSAGGSDEELAIALVVELVASFPVEEPWIAANAGRQNTRSVQRVTSISRTYLRKRWWSEVKKKKKKKRLGVKNNSSEENGPRKPT